MKRPLAMMMTRTIKSIHPDIKLCDIAREMRDLRIGALLVEENNQYIGIVSETDLVRKGMAVGKDPSVESVRGVMSTPIISIDIDRPASDASDLMSTSGVRHLAVTEGGKITGIISVRDLLRYYKNWGSI
jgi:CBS domain-containing protein